MNKIFKNNTIKIIIITSISLILFACGANNPQPEIPEDELDSIEYNIAIITDRGEAFEEINRGYLDGIRDEFGAVNITTNYIEGDDETKISELKKAAELDNTLCFADGENSLRLAQENFSEKPIVATSVLDRSELWDNEYTTGVYANSGLEDHTSLIIETAGSDIQIVGFVYRLDDLNATYQNGIIKEYLYQAGIGWHDYVLNPELTYDEEDLLDLFENVGTECSVLYFASNSNIKNEIDDICDIAHENRVPTVAGDQTLGKYTLASLYLDNYAQGRTAAEISNKILADGLSARDVDKEYPSATNQKLYNKNVADIFDRTFPKSFSEVHNYA